MIDCCFFYKMTSKILVLCGALLSLKSSQALQNNFPPSKVTLETDDNTECPQTIHSSFRDGITKRILDYPMCRCGSAKDWTNVVHLDMSDSSQQCPDNLALVTTPIRGCGRTNPAAYTCDSVEYAVNGRNYSHVCGRVLAYQTGRASGFYNNARQNPKSLEKPYLDGISLTHGLPGSRQHIWSFVKADHYRGTYNTILCPCVHASGDWDHVPTFIGNDYFCESGNPGPYRMDGRFFYDTLWNGLGCQSSTCCEFNTPPWFCKTLPAPTTDDIELRSCYGDDIALGNTTITKIDLYIN